MRQITFIFLILLAMQLSLNVSAAALPQISDFAKNDQWDDVKISPLGNIVSAVTRIDGKKTILLFDSKTFKVLHSVSFGGWSQPGDYYWASAERLVVAVEYQKAWQDRPVNYGEYYAVNTDGSKARYIFGHKNAYNIRNSSMWGEMLDPMPEDSKHVLIRGEKASKSGEHLPKVFKVNIVTGVNKQIARSPVMDGHFLIDQAHQVRFVTGVDEKNKRRSYYYQDDKWVSTAELNIANNSFYPISINGDKNQVYASYAENGEPDGLYLFDLDSGKKTLIYQHKNVSLTAVKTDKSGYVYAVEYDDGYPATSIIDPAHPEAKIFKKLLQVLPGYSLSVINETLNSESKVVYAYNQFNAGYYFLYDVKKDTLSQLFNQRDWVKSELAANVVPFKFNARDGQKIAGYVTLPLGADTLKQAKNLPFVVNVHGGPHNVRDYLVYDAENQLYASRGIGVLQVNYRGSDGYGDAFEDLGRQHWGDKIQFDIIDGITTLVNQGVADKSRLCIIGASFGGYSALQSAIVAPDLFKCSVGIAGVYDLALMHEIGDIPRSRAGRAYLNNAIGADTENVKAFSPLYNLDKLKAAVLIIHGGKDKRVPIEHAQQLKNGLAKRGLPYEWMVFDKEGHSFYKPEHREKVYRRSLNFVMKHLQLEP